MIRNFESIGLTNGVGKSPVLSSRPFILDPYRRKYAFHANGVGLNRFEEKRQSLEAIFKMEVESIRNGRNPGIVEVTVTSKVLTERITFAELQNNQMLPENGFYVGEAMHGTAVAKLQDLPHLLIAGATGGGKSVFFKQVVAGLLKSSAQLQVYMIDLKRGLEAKDFAKISNVAIAKDISEAAQMLGAISQEMERRFKYLESKGFKSIDPKRDKMDRIVIAVDEASELYAEKSKFDEDFDLSLQAQKITNSIARLGRAAGIHLILATQKVQKETINTVIQENVSARMCFKMNTLQGSLQVLGCKDALELPSIPGRGIWQHGAEQFIVQVPFIDEKEIAMVQTSEPSQPMLLGMQKSALQKSIVDLDV